VKNNGSQAPPVRKPAFLSRNLGKLAYHMDFLRSSKDAEGTWLKTAGSPGRGRCPSGILWGEGSAGGDLR